MELAPATDPWTVTVNWARPWHRPVGLPRAYVPAARASERPATGAGEEHEALAAAADEVALARAALADVPLSDDPWPELMARHAIFLARRRLRGIEELLEAPAGIALRHP
ncbi:MAG: hypothetical protein ABI567_00745 [Gammaproteobacteria bacterium]